MTDSSQAGRSARGAGSIADAPGDSDPGGSVTGAFAMSEPPFDGMIFDVGHGNPSTATMMISGVGTTGDVIEAYGEATEGGADTAVATATVGGDGIWRAHVPVAQAAWDNWYRARARRQGDGAYASVENLIGLGHWILPLGQSELAYLFKTGSYYNKLPRTYLSAQNMTLVQDEGDDGVLGTTRVTRENFTQYYGGASSGQSGMTGALLAVSTAIEAARPGRKWGLADGVVPGTSVFNLVDDGRSDRVWAHLEAVVDLIRSGGSDVGVMPLCWYNATASSIARMPENWMPLMTGQRADGSRHDLGTPNPDYTGRDTISIDHCFWDLAGEGRGLFRQGRTKLHTLEQMPFHNVGNVENLEYPNSRSADGKHTRNTRREREGVRRFIAHPQIAAISQRSGHGTHISDFDGGIHPVTDDGWGAANFAHLVLLPPMAEVAGLSVPVPELTAATIGEEEDRIALRIDGLADRLSTGRMDGDLPPPDPLPPHWQPVLGVEMVVNGVRYPIWNGRAVAADPSLYDIGWEGTVALSGDRIDVSLASRLDLETDEVEMRWMEGQATLLLKEARDIPANLHLDMLYTPDARFVDPKADWVFKGWPVRPQPPPGTLALG